MLVTASGGRTVSKNPSTPSLSPSIIALANKVSGSIVLEGNVSLSSSVSDRTVALGLSVGMSSVVVLFRLIFVSILADDFLFLRSFAIAEYKVERSFAEDDGFCCF